jgi:integrase
MWCGLRATISRRTPVAEQLPIRKYITVWVMKRKNNPRKSGKPPTVSYTLQWVLYGKKHVMSLGRGATRAYADRAKREKEEELNNPGHQGFLEPITWQDFRKKYLDLTYPGHDLEGPARKEASRQWGKGLTTMLRERAAMDAFEESGLKGKDLWCQNIPPTSREDFINGRLKDAAPATVESDLGALRYLFGLMEDWRHRPRNSNPFAGKGKSALEDRRKIRHDEDDGDEGYYTLPELQALLRRADEEVLADPDNWTKKRLRALVYFMAYTGCRIKEAIHLDWDKDVDLAAGIVWLRHKRGNRLKTKASAAPLGLPDILVRVLTEWKEVRRDGCPWVFANASGKPWVSAGPGYRHLDQLKTLAERAGLHHATWKMFRHSFDTHGKGRFGMSKEQMQAQLRHTTTDTQKHYDHADLQNLRDAVKGIDYGK